MRQPAEDLVLLQPIGDRHLDGAVERQLALVDALQDLYRDPHHIVAGQQLAAEAGPRDLDLLGQRDFLLAREQWDFAHLRQVHAHRIVRPALAVVVGGQELVGLAFQIKVHGRRFGQELVIVVHHVQIDGLIDKLDRIVGVGGHIVFKFV